MAVEVKRLELYDQVHTFAITLLTGALLGILFDLYRVTSNRLSIRGAMTMVTDFIYWVVATLVVIGSLVFANWLELRMYVLIGLLCGAVTYFQWISRYVLVMIVRLFAGISKLATCLWQGFCFAVIKPLCFLFRLILFPITASRKPLAKGWHRVKQWIPRKKKPPE